MNENTGLSNAQNKHGIETTEVTSTTDMPTSYWRDRFNKDVLPEINSMQSNGIMCYHNLHNSFNYTHYFIHYLGKNSTRKTRDNIRWFIGGCRYTNNENDESLNDTEDIKQCYQWHNEHRQWINDNDYAHQLFLARDFKGRVELLKNMMSNIIAEEFLSIKDLVALITKANTPDVRDKTHNFLISESGVGEFYYIFPDGLKYSYNGGHELDYKSPMPNSEVMRYGCSDLVFRVLGDLRLKSDTSDPQQYAFHNLDVANALFNRDYDNIIMRNLQCYKHPNNIPDCLEEQNEFLVRFKYTPSEMLAFIQKYAGTDDMMSISKAKLALAYSKYHATLAISNVKDGVTALSSSDSLLYVKDNNYYIYAVNYINYIKSCSYNIMSNITKHITKYSYGGVVYIRSFIMSV